MPRYAVRIERVEFTEVEVDAPSLLVARHRVMDDLDELADGQGLQTKYGWHKDGYHVESAREIANGSNSDSNSTRRIG